LASLDVERLRDALRQLAEGVHALHRSQRLHRDLKPSNVLVSEAGRVVICDFGLVLEILPGHVDRSVGCSLVGTAAYMSPEQAASKRLTTASDWYSVGVMLYEALTCRRPHTGDQERVLWEKQVTAPMSAAKVAPAAPADLASLCDRLLRMDPTLRPTGREILEHLGGSEEAPGLASSLSSPSTPSSQSALFLGRARELESLASAYDAARAGCAVTVLLHGGSGLGKSALLQRFIDERVRENGAVALSGRCYEREAVPYKAVDAVIDELSAFLLGLAREEADALMPGDVATLARLFPVLSRVPSVEEPPVRGFVARDPQELRRRAFTALRALMGSIARRWPVILAIDDLQWGDLDSSQLLAELLRPPGAPPLLFLASYRSDATAGSPLLRTLMQRRDAGQGGVGEVRELALDALPHELARDLATSLLGRSANLRIAEAIARESGGNPFFVGELARYLQQSPSGATGPGDINLDEVLTRRVAALPEDDRALLIAVAVAGRPVALAVAVRACEQAVEARGALAHLRATHMLRSAGGGPEERIEPYHDRFREAIVRSLDPGALGRAHECLARAYQEVGGADPEVLVEHWHGAGQLEKAGRQAAVAADQAAAALAFDRAARLYRLALDFGVLDDAQTRELRIRLGEALGNAGRGAEAAAAYLQAIEGAAAGVALELRRRAGECLLKSGHFERGLDTVRTVLDAVGVAIASGPRSALFSLVRRRAWLRLRGTRYRERNETQVPSEDLVRIDILWSTATGLTMIDNIRGADFQTRHLLLCLRTGEPYRIARGLAMEAAHAAIGGGRTRRRTDRLLAEARALATRIDHPHAIGMVSVCAGSVAMLRGEWRQCLTLCTDAERILRDRCTGVAWELATAQFFAHVAMFFLGDLVARAEKVPQHLREAEDRGDRYAANCARFNLNGVYLAADDLHAARENLVRADDVGGRGFFLDHYYALVSSAQIDLHCGDGVAALARVHEAWPAVARAQLLRVQQVRVDMHSLRARSALCVAGSTRDARRIDAAARDAAGMHRERMPWAAGLAHTLDGVVAALRGQTARATELLATAEQELDACAMRLHAAVARYRRGQLLGAAGQGLVAQATQQMLLMGAKNPARTVALLAPGLPQ
jgi:hypothetical protein